MATQRGWEAEAMLKKTVFGVAALGLACAATASQAAPVRFGGSAEVFGPAPARTVQYYYDPGYDDDYAPPPVYRPPYRVYRAPSYGYYYAPRPVYRAPAYGFYDREDAKDYVKGYRRAQKEIFKERARAWNRTHGF
jgi:hypothetical protein